MASASVRAALTLLLRLIDQAGAQMMRFIFSGSRSWVLALWIGFKRKQQQPNTAALASQARSPASKSTQVLFNYIDLV